jgi:hypothetical protein
MLMDSKVKPRHNLQLTSISANLLDEIVARIKSEFRGVDMELLRKDNSNLILFIIEIIEELCQSGRFSKKSLKKLDKNLIVMNVLRLLFNTATAEELDAFEKTLIFILDSKLIKVESTVAKFCRRMSKFFLR